MHLMGVDPYALYSRLRSDLREAISPASYDRIVAGEIDWPGISFRERAASSIHESFLKKLETGLNDETKARALSKFLAVDSRCKTWESRKDGKPGDDYLLGEFKNSLWRFWHVGINPLVDHPYDILERGGVGPGVSIKSPGNDFYTKLFSSNLSCTDLSLYNWYKRYIRGFPEWANAEATRLLTYGEPSVVEGNRLSFVPKNDDISRSICTEPTLNMFYQLGFGAILSSRLRDFTGIDLETQQFKNRELARKGSLDGSFATIDLSSASDSISLKMLHEYLPPDFYRWLVRLRSPTTRLPDGTPHALGMVSTMGNGYTFPLQTILFACIVLSAFRMDGLEPIFPRGVYEGNFGVNGDDIIVPTRICGKVLRLLELLGFQVNEDKTFVEGPFRESCGGDYFQGKNLRGVYVKRLSEPQDLYAVVNQLNLFSTKTGIPLPKTVQHVLSRVRFLPVPFWENDDAGIKVPYSIAEAFVGKCRDTQSILYSAWTATPPQRIRICDKYLIVPKSSKRRIFNLSGLFISFLQRSVNSQSIPILPEKARYKRKRRVAPNWEQVVLSGTFLPETASSLTIQLYKSWFDWERWNSATYFNLYG